MQRLYTVLVFVGAAVGVTITLKGDWLIALLYGRDYIESSAVLKIHVWTGIFVFLGISSSKWLCTENLPWVSFKRVLFGLFLNIVLNLFLIPKFGIAGAAYSILLSQLFAAYLYALFDKQTRRAFYMKTKAFIGRM